jgi:ABC-type Mn2+/Zn2+ transport system ATPase subunit
LDKRLVIVAIAGPNGAGKTFSTTKILPLLSAKWPSSKTENRSSSQHWFLSGCALYVERAFPAEMFFPAAHFDHNATTPVTDLVH